MLASDQPQWGQRYTRNMVSEERGLPNAFDPATGKNIKWTAKLGSEAHATPVIAKGRVLMGTNNQDPRDVQHQGDRGVLMCFDEATGQFLWQLVVPKYSTDPYQDWPRAGLCSPATVEGDRVYVLSNRGEVLCLDIHGQANGNDGPFLDEARFMVPKDASPAQLSSRDADILWVFNIHTEVGSYPHDSAHSSFLLHDHYLYSNTGNGVDNTHRKIRAPDAPSLIVLDTATGKLVAQDAERIGPRIFHSTWSSPALDEAKGHPVVVFGGGDGVVYGFRALTAAATDPSTGNLPRPLEKVWWFDCDPAAPKTNVHQFNGNRRESPSNIKSMPVIQDGRVFLTVGGDVWWGKNQAWLKCIDATKTGDITRTGEVWSYALDRHSMSSPAVWNGLVFTGDSGGKLHCVEARTGKPLWVHQANGEIWATPLVADGKVYVGTQRGEFLVLAATPEKQVLSTLDLGSAVSACAVAANGVLYVANMTHLYALRTPGTGQSGSVQK
jgi:outer membrane protein assembly factor BamB